jgi:glycine/sarcosine N-methyltransferase/sarcosine/dimethylglycine N-methyltransferase
MAGQAFGDLADAYDAMIDWPKRLAAEEPFYRWLFERAGAASVLDAACGTGRHAAMFHSWGLRAEGADISPGMIERCRGQFGESKTLQWQVRGYDQPTGEPGRFDVAICVGNSLALAPDLATLERAVGRLVEAVRPGGWVVLHVLNLWRMADGPVTWQKCRWAELARGESLIVKGVHRCGDRGYVDIVVTMLGSGGPEMQGESVPFWGLEAGDLERLAREAGAGRVEVFGSYKREAYDRLGSQDLIVVAGK